jgi:tetratricopeptide (TPR) repeat protein
VVPSACEGQVLMTSAVEDSPPPEDPLRCDDFVSREYEALPTAAWCRSLPAAARASCGRRVRTRARLALPLREAREARLLESWPLALDRWEAVLEMAPAEPDVLYELGESRYRAWEWCATTQDAPDLEMQLDDVRDGEERPPIAVLCVERATLDQAIDEVQVAVEVAPTIGQQAAWGQRLAELLVARGDDSAALEAARASLCAVEHPESREMVAALLWREGDRAGPSAPEEAVGLYRQAILVAPTPAREATLRVLLSQQRAVFSLSPTSAVTPEEFFPTTHAVCQALVERHGGPSAPSAQREEPCEFGDWAPVGLLRGEDTEAQFRVAQLRVMTPSDYDGYSGEYYLVARSPRGVNVLLHLGEEHGESRSHNAFVGIPAIALIESARRAAGGHLGAGRGGSLRLRLAVLAPARRQPCARWWRERRAASPPPTSGPPSTPATRMLATIQESLGNCEDWVPEPSTSAQRLPSNASTLNVTAQELVATRESDGAMLCLPLRETLSPLRQPAAGQ